MERQLEQIKQIADDYQYSFSEKVYKIHKLTEKTVHEYTDTPRLKDYDDLYYGYAGCDWGVDLDGKWYYKRYDCTLTTNKSYSHLRNGDYINEQARVNKYIDERLKELKLID